MTSPRDALLDQLDAGWQALDRAIRSVPPGHLGEPTPAGWTAAGMLAHLAAWHEATAYRMRGFGATGHPQPLVDDDHDAFNARAVRETAGLPPEAVLGWLRDSFDRLRAAVADLDPELDADGWVARIVALNTFGHYDKHLAELPRGADAG